jgi:hypothetical protein
MLAETSRPGTPIPMLLILGLVGILLLHFVDPDLRMTWGFAHLYRRPYLPWIGITLVFALPLIGNILWRPGVTPETPANLPLASVLAFLTIVFGGTLAASVYWPQVPYSIDSQTFLVSVTRPEADYPPRWYLTTRLYRLVSQTMIPPLDPEVYARGVNALVGAFTLTALVGCARLLARTRSETIAITLLAWSSLGAAEMSIGYLDVYPLPVAMTAIFLWLALGNLAGCRHVFWPVLLAGIGPFFYIGLVLLIPPVVFIADTERRKPGGWRRLILSFVATFLAAGATTLAGHGALFAWPQWYAEAAAASSCGLGLDPTSCLLPLSYMFGMTHLWEMASLILLVDGVGFLLLVVCGLPALLQSPRRVDYRALVLGTIAAAHFAFLLVLDPLFGPYSDWDAYAASMIPVTLLGAWAFVVWGRSNPRIFGALLGLALATSGVHLLARLNAIHVDYRGHLEETPCHVPGCAPPGSYIETCRDCRWDGILLRCECRRRDGHWKPSAHFGSCRTGLFNDDGTLRCGDPE